MTRTTNVSTIHQCTIEFVTCPSCIIRLEFEENNFLSNCKDPKSGACRCDHLILSEPPYNEENDFQYNCGSISPHQTRTRSLLVQFLFWNNYTNAFRLRYQALGE